MRFLLLSSIFFLVLMQKLQGYQSPSKLTFTRNRISLMQSGGTLLGDWGELIKLRESCPPEICIETIISSSIRKSVDLNIIHWLHPVIMFSVLIGLAGSGVYYAQEVVKIRSISKGETKGMSRSDYLKASGNHSTLMSILLFFMLIGSQSGLSSMLVLQQPLLESPHSVTALIATVALTIQAILGSMIERIPSVRGVHKYAGGVVLLILLAHIFSGFWLGVNIDL